jgi:hypothetical protein
MLMVEARDRLELFGTAGGAPRNRAQAERYGISVCSVKQVLRRHRILVSRSAFRRPFGFDSYAEHRD